MKKPDFRSAVFGMAGFGRCVMVQGPTDKAEDCGLYVHVDDLEKYREWEKSIDETSEEKDE